VKISRSESGALTARSAKSLLNGLYLSVLVLFAGLFYLVSTAVILGLIGAAYFLAAGFTVRGKAVEVLVIAGFLAVLFARGYLKRTPYEPLGVRADATRFPRLFAALGEVARNVGTRPADEVFLTPAAGIGVFERSGFLGLFGRSHRVLELGVACLHALTLQEFKAILAHEYAHFSSRETLFRRFVARVRVCLNTAKAQLGASRFKNLSPVYHTVRVYAFFFRYFSSTFSRQREYHADRLASECYGGNVLSSGLIHYACASALFQGPAFHGLFRLGMEGRMLRNLYAAFRAYSGTIGPDDVERIRRQVLKDRSGLLDFHPCPARRIARIRGVNRVPEPSDESARAIFEDPGAVEEELSALLTGRLMGGMGVLDTLRTASAPAGPRQRPDPEDGA